MGIGINSSVRAEFIGRFLAVAVCLAIVGAVARADVTGVYVTSGLEDGSGEVRRTGDLTPSSEELVANITNPIGVAVDSTGGKVYWVSESDWIERSDFDGSNRETLVAGPPGLQDIALDLAHGKMYWTDYAMHRIQRANLDGSEMEDVVTGLSAPLCVEVDTTTDKIYWTDPATQQVQRANLDGTMVEDLLDSNSGVEYPIGIAVDSFAGKVYFCDQGFEQIVRCNLDGTDVEVVLLTERPAFLELDLPAGKMYWSETFGTGVIKRANLDGSAVELVLAPASDVAAGIGYDAATHLMFWSEHDAGQIQRQELPAVQTLATGLAAARGIAIHAAGAGVYWTDWNGATVGTGTIRRACVNGAAAQTLVTDLAGPGAIAVDAENAKVYWADTSEQAIRRMRLDGSMEELVVAGGAAGQPVGLAVDAIGGRIYWSDAGGTIRRADLSGLNGETIVGGVDSPMGIAVDPSGGRVYWTETGATNRILRANLDGSGAEPVLTGLATQPLDIKLDLAAGKIYWTNGIELQRADFAGTDTEVVADMLLRPRGLALSFAGEMLPMVGIITSNTPPGLIQAGTRIVLTAPPGIVFQWRRYGVNIPGATAQTLEFDPVELEDAGVYTVVYEDGSKADVQSEPFVLEVQESGSLPLSGMAVATILAVVLALASCRVARLA